MLAAVDAAFDEDGEAEPKDSTLIPPPITVTRLRTVCAQAAHELQKRPSRFPKLALVGHQSLGDLVLELRNCGCGSTLAKEVKGR